MMHFKRSATATGALVAQGKEEEEVFQENVPTQVDHYKELCPLEQCYHNGHGHHDDDDKSSSVGYSSTVYKAVNSKNGFTYCLRRITGFQLPSAKCLELRIEAWKGLHHCNLVQLREIFATKAFGDDSLIFVYDYFATADTLMERHFHLRTHPQEVNGFVGPSWEAGGGDRRVMMRGGDPFFPPSRTIHQQNCPLKQQDNHMLPENLLWSYMIQLTSVIRKIHNAGLAVRCLDPTTVVLTSRTRPSIRLNCCGMLDVITYGDPDDPNANDLTPLYQQEDLAALGKLILGLACNSLVAGQRQNLVSSLELIGRCYSSDLRNLIVYLMNPRRVSNRSINDIVPMMGARFSDQLELDSSCANNNSRSELIKYHVSKKKETESRKLFRLLIKTSTIIERQVLLLDPQWSETGDRYLLKLFRDYLFRQVEVVAAADGKLRLGDMSQVVYTLNRLEAGALEKVRLMSRDGQNVLIATYAELKQCLEQCVDEDETLDSHPKSTNP